MNLAELQRAFQSHVLNGEETIAAAINQSEAVHVTTRLAVYADAYRLRLADALAHNYPRLQQLLGDENFGVLARDYLDSHPSADPSVRWFGHQLAEYLQRHHPKQPILSELASWEWAIAAAFDAANTEPLTEAAMSAVDPSEWASLRLQLHPSVQLLRMSTNAPAVFKALSSEIEPPSPETLAIPQNWTIWRQEMTPMYRSVPEDEAAALQTLVLQRTFEQLCETLCEWHEADDVPARAVMLLKGWIRDAMIVRIATVD